jgi:hypothetical protein
MTTATLPTRNPHWGFFGTIERAGESAETAWNLASEMIADELGDAAACADEGIRDFLDSRMGRHFADEVAGRIAGSGERGTTLRAAIGAAIAQWQDWRTNRRLERDEGIPAGLPYHEAHVIHYAILAEAEA